MSQPMQPIIVAEDGKVRFQNNAIVRDLLDWATPRGFDLNTIARGGYSQEDQEQFAQLIGYSIAGYAELEYVSDESYEAADEAAKQLAKAESPQ